MIFAILLLLFAILYAFSQRSEPVRIAYTGGVLLAIGAILLIIFITIISNMGPVGRGWEEPLALGSLTNMVILFPSGLIMLIIGLVLDKKKAG